MPKGCLRLKRGTIELANNQIPEDGEFVIVKEENRTFIGDGSTIGGLDVLEGNVNNVDKSSYYGTNFKGQRGFHSISSQVNIPSRLFTIDSSTSSYVTASTSLSFIDSLNFAASNTGSVFTTFKVPDYWSPSKDVNFKINYLLSGSAVADTAVKLQIEIWNLELGEALVVGSPTVTGTEYLYSSGVADLSETTSTIESVLLNNLFTVNTDSIVIKISRLGAAGDDDFTGTFNLVGLDCFQPEFGQSYGYSTGGVTSAITIISSIERLNFPFTYSTTVLKGNLSSELRPSGGCNSSLAGYIFGGADSYVGNPSQAAISTIQKIQFPFDSGDTAESMGTITGGNFSRSAGLNSSSHGYSCGSNNVLLSTSYINRIRFASDYGNAQNVANISSSISNSCGCNSSLAGFVIGGLTVSTTDRFVFPFDTGTAVVEGTLSVATLTDGGSCNSSTHGYIMGGAVASTLISTVHRMTFPFTSGNTTDVGNLSSSIYQSASCNSSKDGFILGGYDNTSKVSTCEKIAFPFAATSSSTAAGNLVAAKYDNIGLDGTDFTNLFV